ncbi:MAG: hypothetical protein KUG81_06230 [Gammaproteobacteria bacterium]|nr:hypothetical protein [Gammaproteobacteria bacterium]
MLRKIGVFLGAIVTLAALMGIGFGVENHFAKEVPTAVAFKQVNDEIQYVSSRIDAMKLEDQLILVKKKISRMEDRWGKVFFDRFERYWQTKAELKGVMPEDYRVEYDELFEEKELLEKQIEETNKPKEGDV